MEKIKKKAHDDELNKSSDDIGQAPRKFVPVPKGADNNFFLKCTQCGRIFDLRREGRISSAVHLCDNCLK